MKKASIIMSAAALTGLSLATFGWQQRRVTPRLHLKEERMTLEYTASSNEAVIVVAAESEISLGNVEIRNPDGTPILKLSADAGQRLAMQGFEVETRETDPRTLFSSYAEGTYDVRAWTVDGHPVIGQAVLSHELPAAPEIVYPYEDAVRVPYKNLTIRWNSVGGAKGYRVGLEQDDNDGIAVTVPPGMNSFRVPNGILFPGKETCVEVGAIGANGNCTLVEHTFTTR